MNGGVKKDDLGTENVAAVEKGCANLGRHVQNVKKFGVPVVVAINHFVSDTGAEIQAVKDYVATLGTEAILCKHWALGSAGIEDLAHKVVEMAESGQAQFAPLYPDDMPLFEKIETSPKSIYHAGEVTAEKSVARATQAVGNQKATAICPSAWPRRSIRSRTDPNLRGAPDRSHRAGARSSIVSGCGFHRRHHRRDP